MSYTTKEKTLATFGIIICPLLFIYSLIILIFFQVDGLDEFVSKLIVAHYGNNFILSMFMLPVFLDIVYDRDTNHTNEWYRFLEIIIRSISLIFFVGSVVFLSIQTWKINYLTPATLFIVIEGILVLGIPSIITSVLTLYSFLCLIIDKLRAKSHSNKGEGLLLINQTPEFIV